MRTYPNSSERAGGGGNRYAEIFTWLGVQAIVYSVQSEIGARRGKPTQDLVKVAKNPAAIDLQRDPKKFCEIRNFLVRFNSD